jgi:hypothetical protein
MPTFNYVEIYPPTGWPDKLWGGERPDPVRDAFLRSSRCVVELYSEQLARCRVPGLRSMLRLTGVHRTVGDSPNVEVLLWSDKPRDLPGEMGFVAVPTAVGDLGPADRARVALEAVHAAVRELAGLRGWDPALVDTCYRHVLEEGFVFSWDSPWKASPDRRHVARATFRLGPQDGFGRVRLEVRRREDTGETEASPPALAFCTSPGFKRSAKTLRWSESSRVAMTPFGGWPSSGHLGASLETDGWTFDVRDDVAILQPASERVSTLSALPRVEVVTQEEWFRDGPRV